MTAAGPNEGALKGIRVIELGQLIAGPFCGQLLGDMGAEMIKVEPPGQGDPMRDWGRRDHKLWWEVVGYNKRSVSANLRVAEGQDIVRRLAAQADILIETTIGQDDDAVYKGLLGMDDETIGRVREDRAI